jgi:hypothetical protein
MTMKLKQLFIAIFATSVLFVSCSKDDVYEPVNQTSIESSQGAGLRTMSTSPTVSTVGTKAYVFIESRTNGSPRNVVDYLKTTQRHPQSSGTRFLSFFVNGITSSNVNDLISYYNIPFWKTDPSLKVIETEVPQVTGGVDSYNNPKLQYNFTTVKIPKGTFNDMGWVTVLIPTSAMNNDTKRQRQIGYYSKNGNRITSSGNNTQTIINTNSTLYSYVLNYTGNVIPQGQYRVYTTHGGFGMRIGFNTTNDVYLRGASN